MSARFETRRSDVHGTGVFALSEFAAGELIIEYVGEIIRTTRITLFTFTWTMPM